MLPVKQISPRKMKYRTALAMVLCLAIAALIVANMYVKQVEVTPAIDSTVSSPASPVRTPATLQFVTRSGSTLSLDGSRFRFAGTNIYWPTMNDFNGTAWCTDNEKACRYTAPFEIDDALIAAQEMGATVVRSNAAVSIGCETCLQAVPAGRGNEVALEHLDYFVKAAKDHGIRLILTLVDNWHYYQGGIHDYVNPKSIAINGVAPTYAERTAFFTDPTLISAFENHISLILNRVNTYTGVAYKDDPTILAWELGNELDDVPTSWISTITSYIKSVDGNHLVAFGQTLGQTGGLSTNSLSVPNLDIEDDHFYPPDIDRLNRDATRAADGNKVYIVGEYDWTTAALGDWLSAISANSLVSGDLFWSLMSHQSSYGTWDDGKFDGTYPGSTPDRQDAFQSLRSHAYAMKGLVPPAAGTPGAPIITSILGNQIAWRGTAVAKDYSVERSVSGPDGGFAVICNRCETDYQTPWTDSSQPGGSAWYRARGYNVAGKAGPYSNTYRVITDPLKDWKSPILYARSPGLRFNTSNAPLLGNDPSRVFRGMSSTNEYIIWKSMGMASFQAVTYFWPDEAVSPFSVYTSADGRIWTLSSPTITGGSGNWLSYTYTLSNLTAVNFVKMVWNNTKGHPWAPQIGQVTIAE